MIDGAFQLILRVVGASPPLEIVTPRGGPGVPLGVTVGLGADDVLPMAFVAITVKA